MAGDLRDLLADQGIVASQFPKGLQLRAGVTSTGLCARCSGGPKRERNFRLTVDDDGFGAVWICHRANNCGWTGSVRVKDAPARPSGPRRRPRRVYKLPLHGVREARQGREALSTPVPSGQTRRSRTRWPRGPASRLCEADQEIESPAFLVNRGASARWGERICHRD
jgi:hypothetical protein